MLFRLPPWRLSAVFSTLEQVLDWSLTLIGAPAAWLKTRGEYTKADGTKGRVKILVIDTGVQVDPMTGKVNHPDLIGAFVAGRDFTGSPFGIGDQNGHGTATASLIAANNNDAGIVGVASDCDVWIAKALGDDGSGLNSWIAAAVDWGDELDVDIISFSGGSAEPDLDLNAAIDRFLAKRPQRFFVAAAGNDGTPNSVNFPASHPEVLAVAAVDKDGRTASFSSRGDQVDCAGPGVGVKACNNRGSYGTYNGTSFACPLLAGIVALMLARHRDVTARNATPLNNFKDLIEHIRRASTDTNDPDGTGWGITRADKMDDGDDVAGDTKEVVAINIGPFVWNMPGKAGAIASIDIAAGQPAEKRAVAAETLKDWIGALGELEKLQQ